MKAIVLKLTEEEPRGKQFIALKKHTLYRIKLASKIIIRLREGKFKGPPEVCRIC